MWTPWYTAAFVLGLLQIVICVFSYLFNSRKITILLKIAFEVLAIVGGICIFEYSQSNALIAVIVIDALQMIREIIFLFREKYKWADHIAWLYIFEAIFLLSLIFTWAGPISLLPTVGGAIAGVALYLKNQKTCKILILFAQFCFITYYALLINTTDLLTILQLISSCTFLVSDIVGLSSILIKERKAKKEAI